MQYTVVGAKGLGSKASASKWVSNREPGSKEYGSKETQDVGYRRKKSMLPKGMHPRRLGSKTGSKGVGLAMAGLIGLINNLGKKPLSLLIHPGFSKGRPHVKLPK